MSSTQRIKKHAESLGMSWSSSSAGLRKPNTYLRASGEVLIMPSKELARFIEDQDKVLTNGRLWAWYCATAAWCTVFVCPYIAAFIQGHKVTRSAHLLGNGVMVCMPN